MKGQARARVYIDTQMMLSDSDTVALANIREDNTGLPQDRRLSILSTIKCMTNILQDRPAHGR